MKRKLFIIFALTLIVHNIYSQKGGSFKAFKTNSDIVYGICFTDKGGALGIADNNTIKVYSASSGELLNEFAGGHKDQILTIDISADSTMLVSGGRDSTLIIWDLLNNTILKSLTFQKGIITSVKISKDCKYLLSGGTDNKVFLYDLEQGKLVCVFTDHSDDITSVDFSPDGSLIASASGDKSVNVYNFETKELIKSLKGHSDWVRCVSFNNNGTKLISCGDDSRINTWGVTDNSDVMKRESSIFFAGWLLSVDFHSENDTYAWGSSAGKVKVKVMRFGSYRINLHVPVNKILFWPDEGSQLKFVVATRGKGVFMFDAAEMKPAV